MPSYGLFFSEELGVGIYPVQVMAPDHAMDIVRADHPQARMRVIPAERLDGTDRWKMLFAWLDAIGSHQRHLGLLGPIKQHQITVERPTPPMASPTTTSCSVPIGDGINSRFRSVRSSM